MESKNLTFPPEWTVTPDLTIGVALDLVGFALVFTGVAILLWNGKRWT